MLFSILKGNKSISKILQIVAFMAIIGIGYTAFADEASAACMDTSGYHDYNWNLYSVCTDANAYSSGADTVDVAWHVDGNKAPGTHYWTMNLQLYNNIYQRWDNKLTTYSGYVSSSSPSYRSWNINSLTMLYSPVYNDYFANARIKITMTGGAYKGDVYYTTVFKIYKQ